jgi:hypothetical protein
MRFESIANTSTLIKVTHLQIQDREKVRMTTEELMAATVVASWKQIVGRVSAMVEAYPSERFEVQIAPGKNRVRYLIGHLTALNDRLFPALGLGERLHPELDEAYVANPDGARPDPISVEELKKAWVEVNGRLTAAFEAMPLADWLQRHTAVSEEDFAKEPLRNRLAMVLSRVNHVSFHAGQAVLTK